MKFFLKFDNKLSLNNIKSYTFNFYISLKHTFKKISKFLLLCLT